MYKKKLNLNIPFDFAYSFWSNNVDYSHKESIVIQCFPIK